MGKHSLFLLPVFLLALGCNSSAYSAVKIPMEQHPPNLIAPDLLSKYTIAFCLGRKSDVPTNGEEGEELVNVVVMHGDSSRSLTLATSDLRFHPSPYITQEQVGHPEDNDLGCIDAAGIDARFNSEEIFWKPNSSEISFLAGVDPMSADFRLFEVQENYEFFEKDPLFVYHDYNMFFSWPRGVYWSPGADKVATIGSNDQLGRFGTNVWAYDSARDEFSDLTGYEKLETKWLRLPGLAMV